MSYSIIVTPNFAKELKSLAKRHTSIKADLIILSQLLIEMPTQGVEIFKNCYKIRFAIKSKGKGKSGGGRLITFIKIQNESIYLLSVYDKSDRESISDHTLKYLLNDLDR